MVGPKPQFDEPRVPLTVGDLFRQLEWRSELLGVLLVLAEAVVVYLFAGVILATDDTLQAFPFWVIAFVMLTAHLVSHLLDVGRIWSPDFEIVLTVAVVVTLLVTFKAGSFPHYAVYDPSWLVEAANGLAFFAADAVRSVWGCVVIVVYAWWRGRTRDEPTIDSAYTLLRWGTLALGVGVVFVLITAPEGSEVLDRLSIATLGYFAFALGAIGLARMRVEGFRTSSSLEAPWLATFFVPILIIVLVAVLGAGIFSRQFLDTALWLLSPLLWVLEQVFRLLILIIAVLAYIILTPIFWLIGDRELFSAPATAGPTPTETPQEQPSSEIFELPEPLQYLIAAIFLVFVISLLVRFIYRRRSRRRPETSEERESIFNWDDVLGSLGGRLRGIFARPAEIDPFANLRGDPRWRHTLTIREHYRRLQDLGKRHQQPRKSGDTAEEYRPRIEGVLGDSVEGRRAVDEMTAIYRAARYSGQPASEHSADRMVDRWRVVERSEPKEDD